MTVSKYTPYLVSTSEGPCQIITINVPARWIAMMDKMVTVDGVPSRSEFIRNAIRAYLKECKEFDRFLGKIESGIEGVIEKEGYVYVPQLGYRKIVRRLE